MTRFLKAAVLMVVFVSTIVGTTLMLLACAVSWGGEEYQVAVLWESGCFVSDHMGVSIGWGEWCQKAPFCLWSACVGFFLVAYAAGEIYQRRLRLCHW
jgi:hypothetical protein